MSQQIDPDEQRAKQEASQRRVQMAQTGHQVGSQAVASSLEDRIENPEFLDKLRDLGLEDEQLRQLVGPAAAGAHVTANRGEDFAQERKFLNLNEAERVVVERDTGGRLCKGPIAQAVAQAHGDATMRRRIRDAYQAITSQQSLGAEGEGVRTVGEATVVNRTEETEAEEESGVASTLGGIYS